MLLFDILAFVSVAALTVLVGLTLFRSVKLLWEVMRGNLWRRG